MTEEARGGRGALREVAAVFLRLGLLGFGGPAAHVALMRHELVERRRWLSEQEFLEYLGAANVVPGPTSTELALHLGRRRGGAAGILVAGLCFIVPPALLVGLAAWGYQRYGALPPVEAVLYGLKPVVIAVVAQALWSLGRGALRGRRAMAVGAGSLLLAALGLPELTVLALAALGAMLHLPGKGRVRALVLIGLPAGGAAVSPLGLFGVFLKIGSVLFGSGYVLLAFLRGELVERLGWLTERQLLDAVAVGQVTPGPLFTTATFIGYLLGGVAGAAAATTGIFLPAFVFVGVSGWLLPAVRRSARASAALEGVTVASLALMAVVTVQLARAALVDPTTIALALTSAFLLLRFRVSPGWLVPLGAAVGLLAYRA